MLCCCSPKKSHHLVRGVGVQSPPKRIVFRFHEAFSEGEPGSLGFAVRYMFFFLIISPLRHISLAVDVLESSWKSGCWGSIWWRSPMQKNRRSGFLGNFWMNQWMNQVCPFTFRFTLCILVEEDISFSEDWAMIVNDNLSHWAVCPAASLSFWGHWIHWIFVCFAFFFWCIRPPDPAMTGI